MEPSFKHNILFSDNQIQTPWTGSLICEEPLSIWIQETPFSVGMRTPGNELAQAAGFCLGEGIVDSPEDIASLAFCDGNNTNGVILTLSETRKNLVADDIQQHRLSNQTHCGLCGKEMVDELCRVLEPLKKPIAFSAETALKLIHRLPDYQPLREQTRAAHAAAIFNSDFDLLSVAEDVGRHNALDKAIGTLLLDHKLKHAAILVLSSRISYELVQKTARAKIPVILAVSRPTALAVSLAAKLDITLACLSKKPGIDIYCGKHRIR